MDVDSMRTELQNHGQEQLLKFWENLSQEHRELLYNDIKSINLADVNSYFKQCKADMEKLHEKVDDHLRPIPQDNMGSVTRTDPETLTQYEEIGLRQIGEGKVAVLLMAGGQGTRLGVPYPKGMYDVGLPSHRTLYQLQAERLVKVQRLARNLTGKDGKVPWYIMTSEHTKESTLAFFKKHNFFGLSPDDVTLFEQNMLPALTLDGQIILEKPYKVHKAPDGNGGLYKALRDKKILDDIVSRGIEYLHVYCVDNILVKMADPTFIGFCVDKKAVCGAKVVEKSVPTEPVGVVCKVDDVFQVVEYSEISLKTAEKRSQDGRLLFNAGNICNHFFTLEFLKMVCQEREGDLRHHVAKKKIPYVNEDGETVRPAQPNGVKMEKFVFDVFQFCSDRDFAVWEVLREDEFSPLKNADGAAKDTPTTSRHALFNLHQRYVIKAGGKFVREDGTVMPDIPSHGNGVQNGSSDSHQEDQDEQTVVCEISPLLSYAGEGLGSKVKGKCFVPPLVLSSPEDKEKDNIVVKT